MALTLRRLFNRIPRQGLIVHLAPEASIAEMLHKRFGKRYIPADFYPDDRFKDLPVRRADLSNLPASFPPNSLALLLHSHVLEHVFAPVSDIFKSANSVISPGGFHLFQVPVRPGRTDEDLDPGLPPSERLRRFDQEDHVRVFGADDFKNEVLDLFSDYDRYPVDQVISARRLKCAAVPASALRGFTGNTPFIFQKRKE